MRAMIGTVALVVAGTLAVGAQVSSGEARRIKDAAAVLSEIHGQPDKDIPQELWERANCVIVIPDLKKAAFVFGGEYGAGLMSCRHDGGWSAPVFMQLAKGSWGLQIGAESIDLVLLVMNERGMAKMLEDKVSLGAGISIAVGPVGRTAAAATDAQMGAEIISYSRAQGLFAGIDISGGVLRPDEDANRNLYGRARTAREILSDGAMVPLEAQPLVTALQRQYSIALR